MLDLSRPEAWRASPARFGANLFFANRRPDDEKMGLRRERWRRCGPHRTMSISRLWPAGPWLGASVMNHVAGVSGILALEASVEAPKPRDLRRHDYVAAWIAMIGAIAALRRRAQRRKLPRQTCLGSLSRLVWSANGYSRRLSAVAGTAGAHAYREPKFSKPNAMRALSRGD